ncbi:MAG: TVP38/TMEM64 family protein [Ruminococcaceae bacterium]|nr:TVP38/TMEM64 family protein [Oscillospiraceae bacterium]
MNKTEKTKKILALLSLAVVIILALLATLFVWKWLSSFSEDGFRDYIRSFGPWGWLVLFGVQFLQVFIALIPGEVVETAAGYAFGPLWGTVICYAGVALASAFIFLLTRRFGVRLVEVFVSREKINSLKFIKTEKKRNFLIFILFFVPGTPKDLITYFAGLTDIKITEFLCISLVARFPSVISSTFGGHLLGEGQYIHALLLYGITGAVSIAGMLIYNKIIKSRREKKK